MYKIVKLWRGYRRGGCFGGFGINLCACHLVRKWEVFLSVAVGDPVFHKWHAMHKMHTTIFCGCTIWIMIHYSCFLIFTPFPLYSNVKCYSVQYLNTNLLSSALTCFSDQFLHAVSSPTILLNCWCFFVCKKIHSFSAYKLHDISSDYNHLSQFKFYQATM